MLNKMIFNFRMLLSLLDEQIYRSFSDHESSDNIISHIPWDKIYKTFPSKEIFLHTLSIYHQTIISEKNQNGNFSMRSLVISCEVNGTGIEIKHSTSALYIYLFHDDKSIVENSAIENIFLNALTRFNMKSDVLYAIISKNKQFKTTPEDLKAMLGINYTNAMLKSRVLLPVENAINKLYEEGQIPFYIKINIERAVIGRGSKINNVLIDTINDIDLLHLKHMRPQYMHSIMKQLMVLFPFDYPFLEEDIKRKDDETIKNIYDMISNIEQDPDYRKIETSILVRYKLQQNYSIKIKS